MSQDAEAEDAKRWIALARKVAASDRKKTSDKGYIVMIGSGIKAVGQFTLETISEIKGADSVFFCVADPVTALFIKSLRSDALDLYVQYDDNKKRLITYIQWSEIMLHEARKGKYVVGIFYGHPGVFVAPSHRVLKIAKDEGIESMMLPALCAADCLFADIGIDPAYPGLMTLEATDFLLRDRTILTDRHVFLWQVGCVGNSGFRRKGFLKEKLDILIHKLQSIYGKDYEIYNYIAAHFPVCDSVIDKLPLSRFLEPEIRKKVTGCSTFYIPPKAKKTMKIQPATDLGVINNTTTVRQLMDSSDRVIGDYSESELKIIADLKNWSVPNSHLYPVQSEISDKMIELNVDVKQAREIKDGYPFNENQEHMSDLQQNENSRICNLLSREKK